MKYEFFSDNGIAMVKITSEDSNCVVRPATPEDHAAAEAQAAPERERKTKGITLDDSKPGLDAPSAASEEPYGILNRRVKSKPVKVDRRRKESP